MLGKPPLPLQDYFSGCLFSLGKFSSCVQMEFPQGELLHIAPHLLHVTPWKKEVSIFSLATLYIQEHGYKVFPKTSHLQVKQAQLLAFPW